MNLAFWAALAIVGGTVHPGDGPPIEGATVVIDGETGRVTAVGADVPVPEGAKVIDAYGAVVTPGFVDPFTHLGLVEIWGVAGTRHLDAGGEHPIRAAFRAADAFDGGSAAIPIQRAHGVTTVGSAPTGGLVAGQMGVFDLGDPPSTVAPSAAMVVYLGGGGDRSRGARLLALREVLDDARAYAKNRRAFEQNRFRRTAAGRLDLEALIPVVEGRTPLAVVVDRASDIRAVLRVADEQRVKVLIVGGAEAWKVADELAARRIPVAVDPSENLPGSFDSIGARADNAARLHRAGVPVLISTFSVHNVRKLRQWAGNAVREGLPHDAALRAVTAGAADALGLKDRGRLAPGAVANVVVWSGDPFELSTRVRHLVVGGRPVSLMHRQRALFERYRRIPPR